MRSLVIGKFYPPHAGHHALIDLASEGSERTYVAVCYSSVESIPVEDRIEWLRDRHPSPRIRFFAVKDDSPVNYTDETWDIFMSALLFGGKDGEHGLVSAMRSHGLSDNYLLPTVVYSGESYAPELARRLWNALNEKLDLIGGCPEIGFHIVDRDAIMAGVSASAFRADPLHYWDLLAPATRAGMAKRVVVCGAESSGTTTLAKALSDHYKTTVVSEYGRYFDWGVGKHHRWVPEDFYHIAGEQRRWENNLARESHNGLLICDTDEYATAMFHQVYLDSGIPTTIMHMAAKSPADLYLVTDDVGIDFEDDGTRLDSGRRPWMTSWFMNTLPGNVLLMRGSHERRLSHAVAAVDKLLAEGWNLEDPIEYRAAYEHDGIAQMSANAPQKIVR